MPTNPTVEYQLTEEEYRKAKTIQEKIKALENMLAKAPKHKSSENLLSQIKQKLAKFRGLLEKEKTKAKGKQLTIKKEGAARVVLIGIANSGKSLLLSRLTNAKPLVSEAEYTTKQPEIGVIDYEGVKLQIIEIPPLFKECIYRYGEFFGLIRTSELILALLDSTKNIEEQHSLIKSELEGAQIKINIKKPNIKIRKEGSGGISFIGENYLKAEKEDALALLRNLGIINATISLYENTSIETLADAANQPLVCLPCIFIFNKCDISEENCPSNNYICISAQTGRGIESLKQKIWDSLELIRVFTKSPGKEKDFPPIALKKESTIQTLAQSIHKDFMRKFRKTDRKGKMITAKAWARVWGSSARFPGVRVGFDHMLEDGDIVEMHMAK
ncbi:50S ribosome-binding GTPase [archaeon]|nr:50S ribosome-binding GTPase [archaeon]